ncbi:tRNA (N6-isopentenyl adenosine(37)-C2)-methylthiotransferase MiaB [Ruminococcaceae bacterium OttesenSCG-928-A16]|nr:tRNA (N6-isopentenyl adenosine(37)-C2)-methylthiotransferase MiaB [Ruminococcaceae bacterium OttesenSCG-928-A16]
MERLEYTRNQQAADVLASHYGRTPVAFVRSFGCQQSVNDGERLKGVLEDVGFTIAEEADGADVILFNTCAVREHAEQRAFGNIGALKALKDQNPALLIGVCGCMTEQKAVVDKIKKSYPYVDMALGANVADELPAILVEKLTTRKKALRVPQKRETIVEDIPQKRASGIKAFLPIMYGCDNYCSYCIVPYVRGRERSRKPAAIQKEFEELLAAGYKDITLLGQNVNSYGKGLKEKLDFSDLLTQLAAVPGEYKLRFMTSHPKDATRKMIDTIAENPRLCKHVHLPIQSGSNNILSRMNRKYAVEDYLALVKYAKETCPEMTFSTDIMVGFPGETEEDFEETMQLCKEVGFTQIFTFIYSKRSGTKAAELPDETTHRAKAARITRLKAQQEEQIADVAKGWLGKTYVCLVEGPARDDKTLLSARLDNNATVEFAGDKALVGHFVPITMQSIKGAILQGTLKQN